ncbi:hypothetical protein [Antrihabitans stalactiti]|nr:hypothetical protein [Antrihabitans stalactiti]
MRIVSPVFADEGWIPVEYFGDFESAIEGHVLDKAVLMGEFQR